MDGEGLATACPSSNAVPECRRFEKKILDKMRLIHGITEKMVEEQAKKLGKLKEAQAEFGDTSGEKAVLDELMKLDEL